MIQKEQRLDLNKFNFSENKKATANSQIFVPFAARTMKPVLKSLSRFYGRTFHRAELWSYRKVSRENFRRQVSLFFKEILKMVFQYFPFPKFRNLVYVTLPIKLNFTVGYTLATAKIPSRGFGRQTTLVKNRYSM